jgi:hypothetical protein
VGNSALDNALVNETTMNHLSEAFDVDTKEWQIYYGPHVLNPVVKAMIYGAKNDELVKLVDLDEGIYHESASTTITATYLKRYRKEGPIGKLHNHCVCLNYRSQWWHSLLNPREAIIIFVVNTYFPRGRSSVGSQRLHMLAI